MNTVSINTSLNSGSDVTVSSESELMKYHQAALPLAPEQELAAIYDAEGYPLIFSFSPDGDLYVICHASDHPTGWNQIDLTPTVKDYGIPKMFDVCQLAGGALFLTLSIQDVNDAGTENLFIAGPLSNDLSQTDFSKLSNVWIKATNPEKGTTVQKIFSSPVDDGSGNGIPILAVSLNVVDDSEISLYILKSNVDPASGAVSWSWLDFPTPTSKASLIDFAPGSIGDMGQGLYMLYNGEGNETFLVFKTYDNAYGKSYDRQFTAPAGASVLQATAGDGKTTALFVGGSGGIQYFDASNQASQAAGLEIAAGSALSAIDADGLIVRQDELKPDVIDIWALSQGNVYYLQSNYNGDPTAWSDVLLFGKGIARIAPLRNSQKYANELIYIGIDEDETRTISYMWQDPVTTLWNESIIPLEDTGNILEFNCYATHVAFQDADNSPVSSQAFNITCDSWLNVIINGLSYSIDATTAATVQTDLNGVITILTRCSDIDAPMLHITADIFTGTLDISPNCNAYSILNAVATDSDIPVLPATLPDGVKTGDISGTVKGIMQFHPPAGSPQTLALSFRPADTPLSPLLPPASLPEGTSFGLSFTGGATLLHDSASVQKNLKSSGLNDIKALGGDVIHFLHQVVDDVESVYFEIQQGGLLQFVAKIGDQIATFTLDHFPKLYKAISWVLNKIKIGLEDLIKWLGKVFDWKDIWTMHKVIAAMMTGTLNYAVDTAEKNISALEDKVDNIFEDIRQKIQSAVLPDNVNLPTSAGAKQAQSSIFSKSVHPGANWANYQVQHGGIALPGGIELSSTNPLVQFFEDVVEPLLDTLGDDVKQDAQDIVQLFKSSGGAMLPALYKLIIDLADTAIDFVQKIITGLLKLISDLLTDFQAAMEESLDMPFLSSMYKWVIGVLGEEEDLTVINGVALLVAIPTTFIYNIVEDASLFINGTYGIDDPAVVERILNGTQQNSLEATGSGKLRAAVLNDSTTATGDDQAPSGDEQAKTFYSGIGGIVASAFSLVTGGTGGKDVWKSVLSGQKKVNYTDQSAGLQRIIGALDLAGIAGSFPLWDDGPDAQWGLRFPAWVIASVNTMVSDFSGDKIKDEVKGILQAVTCGITGGLLLAADGVDDDTNDASWVMDVFSNVGGLSFGLGSFFREVEPLGIILSASGSVLSIVGCGVGVGYSCANFKRDATTHTVNVGG